MSFRWLILLLTLAMPLAFHCVHGYSQTYNFTHYTVENGLPQSQVMDILQDKKGYLWIATNGGGVSRFDGKRFTVYTTSDGLSSNTIYALLEDSKGNIWMGTGHGLSRFDGAGFQAFDEENGLNAKEIYTLCEDEKGIIWIGTAHNGVIRYDGNLFSDFPLTMHNGTKINNNIRSIIEDRKDNIWIGTGAGIFYYTSDTMIHFEKGSGLCGFTVWKIFQDRKDVIWSGSFGEGFCRYFQTGQQFLSFPYLGGIGSHGMVLEIKDDDKGELWVGTDGDGLYQFTLNEARDSVTGVLHITEKQGLLNNRVRSIFQDREGNIWVGSDGGLSRFDGGKFVLYGQKDGLPSNTVLSFFEDSAQRLLVGSQNGLSSLENDTFSIFKTSKNRSFNSFVWSILQDSENNYWLGTYREGAYRYDGKTLLNYSHPQGLKNDIIFSLAEDTNGNIWLGSDGGAGIYTRDSLYVFTVNEGLRNDRIRCLYADEKGNVWIGTRGGLIKYNAGQDVISGNFENISINEKVDRSIIFGVTKDSLSGNLWLGTYGQGLIYYHPEDGRYTQISSSEGLNDDNVLLLTEDYPYLWVGTVQGLNRLNLEQFHLDGTIQVKHYGKEDGFKGVECNQNAVCKESDGKIWFGTAAGAVRYDPRYDRDNRQEPNIYISGVRLFFESPDWSKYASQTDHQTQLPVNTVLPYQQNHLTFDFVGLNFTAPEKVRYRYMLEGLDKDYSPITPETYASYPSIPPGDYVFKVIACNNEGVWNQNPAVFHFTIHPPFWQTYWFYGLFFLAATGGGIGFVKFRTNKLRQAKRELEEEVKKRTLELHNKNERLEHQNGVIEQKNRDITDSISYAKRIQKVILPDKRLMKSTFEDAFILFRPKDIVSGDFHWMKSISSSPNETAETVLFGVVDCTGHGVPGAFVSIVGHNALNRTVNEFGLIQPAEILDKVNDLVEESFSQSGQGIQDGMDIALCSWNKEKNILQFAGANNPLWMIRGGECIETKGDKQPIGSYENRKSFSNHSFELKKGDSIYIFSDGYADQFGGDDQSRTAGGKKFKYSRFKNLLLSIHTKPMEQQEEILAEELEKWKGELEQIDDICIMGIRI